MGHFDSCWTEACIRLNFVLPDAINLKKKLSPYLYSLLLLSLSLSLPLDRFVYMYVCMYILYVR